MRTTSFLHSLILILCFQFPSTTFLPCFQREKKSYVRSRSYYHIWHLNLCTTSGAEWELITPCKHHNSDVSEENIQPWNHDDISKWEFKFPLPRQPYVTWLQIWWCLNLEILHKESNLHRNLPYFKLQNNQKGHLISVLHPKSGKCALYPSSDAFPELSSNCHRYSHQSNTNDFQHGMLRLPQI